MRPIRLWRAWIVLTALVWIPSCGVVEEDGGRLSERSFRELAGAAETLESRGENLRAAEIYEALGLGFPDQYWADEALLKAAGNRGAAALRAVPSPDPAQMARAERLFSLVIQRERGSPMALRAQMQMGGLFARSGDCRRAAPILREALDRLDPGRPPGSERQEALRLLDRCESESR